MPARRRCSSATWRAKKRSSSPCAVRDAIKETTILVSTADTAGGAGVLHHLLQPLAEHGVVMTFIESRPSRRKNWDYVFFIDVDGHADNAPVAAALAELEHSASLFKVLGAYPKAIG